MQNKIFILLFTYDNSFFSFFNTRRIILEFIVSDLGLVLMPCFNTSWVGNDLLFLLGTIWGNLNLNFFLLLIYNFFITNFCANDSTMSLSDQAPSR